MIIEELQKLVGDSFKFEHPGNLDHGDYSCHARGLATELAVKINKEKPAWLERVAVVGGFINFYFSPEFFTQAIIEINQKKNNFGQSDNLKNKKVIIEYTNTNILKPLHIGHLMGNVIGESLSRLIEKNGAEVKRNTYQGDVGLHVAKAVWGITKLGGVIESSLSEQVEYIGKAYALGAEAYETDVQATEEIKEINKKLYDKNDEELSTIYVWGKRVSLEHFEELYKKLGTKFDFYFFESEVAGEATAITKEFLGKGIFKESGGAIVFEGEKFEPNLHTRVFVTKQGVPTYESKDIAHALRKFEKYPADESIIITANEQDAYFKVVLRALWEIRPEVAKRTKHLSHGMLKLATGKMSSRKGNVITGESLISDVESLVEEKISDRELSETDKEKIATQVAIAALKYSILRQSPGKDIIFDFAKSLSFEGDSGPYLQYTCVRAKAVVAKANKKIDLDILAKETEREGSAISLVERILYRFPEVVERSASDYSPNYLITYLTELASAFNSYYAVNKIIGNEEENYRLALTNAVAQVLENGLDLLGITVPEKM